MIKYREDWSLEDYIEAAGGRIVDLEYRTGSAVVYYSGGNAKVDDGWFFTPTVKEGSIIQIPKIRKEPKEDWAKEVRNWMTLVTSAITVVLLVQAAQN